MLRDHLELGARAARGDHRGPEGLGELDGGETGGPRGTVNQDGLSGLEVAAGDQAVPRGLVAPGEVARLREGEALRLGRTARAGATA